MKKVTYHHLTLLCFFVMTSAPTLLFGQTICNWFGSVNNNWHQPLNWIPNKVPEITDLAIITPVGQSPTIHPGTDTFAKCVVVQKNAQLTVSGTLEISISNAAPIHPFTNDRGISNAGSVLNTQSGVIKIRSIWVMQNGYGINSLTGTGSTFVNLGLIKINTDDILVEPIPIGLQAAHFINVGGDAMIQIGNVGDGIRVKGRFENNDNATIIIQKTQVIGILNNNFLGNNNSVLINNNSLIQIDDSSGDGLENVGKFFNENSGIIKIGETSPIARIGLFNVTGKFTNDASTIEIHQADVDGIQNQAEIENKNSAIIRIGSSDPTKVIGRLGIVTTNANSKFTNNDSQVFIDHTSSIGFLNQASAQTINENEGEINIGQVATISRFGIANAADASFSNDNSTIRIDHIVNTTPGDGDGILNVGASFENKNNAEILIGQQNTVDRTGILCTGLVSIFTNDGSTIKIDNTTANGLVSLDTTQIINQNGGQLLIGVNGGNIGGSGILNNSSSEIKNNDCSVIRLAAKLENNSIFTNNGLLSIDFNQNHSNNGLTNNGIIEMIQLPLIPNVTNNELVIAPISGECAITPALMVGSGGSFTASSEWFKNMAQTDKAGDYAPPNTFTITDLAEGTHTLYFEASSNTCDFDVSIEVDYDDVTAPVPTCKDPTVQLDANGNYVLLEADVFDGGSDNCGSVNYVGTSPTSVSCTDVGTPVSITVTANDGLGNEGTCTATVTVEDNSPPTANCPTSINDVVLDASGDGSLPANIGDGSSTDNCTATETSPAMSFTCTDLGSQTVTLTASDGTSSVTTTCSFDVVDNIAPTANCPASIPDVVLDASGNGTLPANIGDGSSTDNCTPTETSPAMNFTCADLGSQTVILTANDGTNSVTASCSFNVVDNTTPTAICPATIPDVVLDASGNGTLPANIGDGSSTDNCTPTETSPTMNFTSVDLGTQTVILTASNGSGSSTATCSFNVVDNSPPTANCPASITDVVLDTSGDGNLPANIGDGSKHRQQRPADRDQPSHEFYLCRPRITDGHAHRFRWDEHQFDQLQFHRGGQQPADGKLPSIHQRCRPRLKRQRHPPCRHRRR